jgi:3-phenylpropionate/trans-cinnamate dioxygenase ferredoxin reductase subunit
VALADSSRIGYARLLLATGSSPRRLPVPGADADGVLYLRRVGDSDQIKATFQTASRIAVIGAGWIGLECAAAARAAGVEVTLLEAAELPLLRVLGPEVARVFAGLHREHGVDLRFGVQVSEITTAGGRANGVGLADGSHVAADAIVVGIGITPNNQLAEAAGLQVRNGVVVDAGLRSADPDIFAAGTSPTTRSRTSTPTSTTWAWSTRATSSPAATTRSCSAATWTGASSSPSGWARGASWPA